MKSYIDMINAFWNWRTFNPISSKAADLYFALLNVANRCGWKEDLSVPNTVLMSLTGMEKWDLYRSRDTLVEYGLIEYVPGGTRRAGVYRLTDITGAVFGSGCQADGDIGCNISCKNDPNSATSDEIGCSIGSNIGCKNQPNSATNEPIGSRISSRISCKNQPNSATLYKTKTKTKTKDNTTPYNPPPQSEQMPPPSEDVKEVFRSWDRASGRCMTAAQSEELCLLLDEFGKERLLAAIRCAVSNDAVRLGYIRGVLENRRKEPQNTEGREKSALLRWMEGGVSGEP